MTKSAKGTALVTGASSGIGAIYADRLARRGYDLILVARNRERLDGLARRLSAETGRSIEIVAADLAKRGDVARIESILRDNAGISVLVNNAGVGATAPLLASDVDKMSDMIALNVDALMRLTYAAVPGFVARGGGTIVNIASVVGVAPEMLNGVYGGSKAYVTAFTQALNKELAGKGVKVQAVLPGATATDFWQIGGLPVENLDPAIVMSAQDLVDGALQDFDNGVLISLPSLHDLQAFDQYEAGRQALFGLLSSNQLAPRYSVE
jgi:short-subunit dehydrogenase